jgi:hypothetical protein
VADRLDVDATGRATWRSDARTVIGMLLIALLVGLAVLNIIAWAANRGDDVRATRQAVETIKPCRP